MFANGLCDVNDRGPDRKFKLAAIGRRSCATRKSVRAEATRVHRTCVKMYEIMAIVLGLLGRAEAWKK
jgi:hypothetical protein